MPKIVFWVFIGVSGDSGNEDISVFFCFFMIFRAGGKIVGAGAEISGAGIEILGAGREILGVQGLNLGPEGEIWGLLDKLFFDILFFFAF